MDRVLGSVILRSKPGTDQVGDDHHSDYRGKDECKDSGDDWRTSVAFRMWRKLL
jgi:hypothetical protein